MEKIVYFFDFWKTLVYSEFEGINLKEQLSFTELEVIKYQNILFKTNLSLNQIIPYIANKFNLDVDQVKIIKDLNNNIEANAKLYEDSLEALEVLRQDYNLYLISDGFSLTEKIFKKLIPSKLFSKSFFSNQFGLLKSEGLIELVMQELNLSPNQIKFVGDSVKRDYIPCQEMGIQCTLINRGLNKSTKHIITNLNQLK